MGSALALAIYGLIGNKFEIIIGSRGFLKGLGWIIAILLKNKTMDLVVMIQLEQKMSSLEEWVGP